MPRKAINLEIDFMKNDIFPKFTVKQFDDTTLNIKPLMNGVDYPATNMVGKVYVGVGDDLFKQESGILVSSNNINIVLNKAMLQKHGRAYLEVELTDSSGSIASLNTIFIIEGKVGEGATIPGEYEGFVAKYERLIAQFKAEANLVFSSCNNKVNTLIVEADGIIKAKISDLEAKVNNKITEIDNKFETLTSQQQQDAEVVNARDGEVSLNARIERDLAKGKVHFETVEGASISVDSVEGYCKNIEIKGNTIQDPNNLADIRSVGDKVEGQELYRIPLLCTNGLEKTNPNYQENKLTILSPKQLKSFDGVKDRIVEKNGIWTHEENITYDAQGVGTKLKTPIDTQLPHSQQVVLKTFANRTNISFLCDVEGTIKADVPKSLGATVNTHTTQIDSLNQELDRVKKLEESTVSTVVTDKDFTVVEQTNQGYFEDIELKGRTEVNKLGNKKISNGFDQSSINGVIPNISTIMTLINTTNTYEIHVMLFNSGVHKSSRYLTINNPMILLDTTIYDEVRLRLNGRDNLLPQSVVCLEGDHTQNPPQYFEGLKSVGDGTDEIVVSSVGENLFDGELELGTYNINTGSKESYDNAVRSIKPFVINGGSPIHIQKYSIDSTIGTRYYDSNMNYLKGTNQSVAESYGIVSTPSDARYMNIIQIGNNLNSTISISHVRLDEYTPHKADKKKLLYFDPTDNTWKKPILDEFSTIKKGNDGVYRYHQRGEKVVLNGSEGWLSDTSNNNTLLFKANINDMKTFGGVISDKFSYDSAIFDSDNEGMRVSSTTPTLYIRISKSKLTTQDVAGFKKWLQTNNVTVVYQLAEEQVYECTNIDLITYPNETNFTVKSGVLSPKTTLKVHSNISNVVSLLQKKVSLLESNMSKYMVTQNRLMLDSRYIADNVTFTVDVAGASNKTVEYDNDLYKLLLNNIIIGKDNYKRDKMETIIDFYAMSFAISFEECFELLDLIEYQHNPPITDGEVEI